MKTKTQTLVAVINVAATGVLFGLLQWGAFFQLQSFLASTALVWLAATITWLAGSLIGLLLKTSWHEAYWILATISAYLSLIWLARWHPYDFAWMPVLLGCVLVMGAYAGRFFLLRERVFGRVKWLFFIENTGFVVGSIAALVLLYQVGLAALALAPGLTAAVCLLTLGRSNVGEVEPEA